MIHRYPLLAIATPGTTGQALKLIIREVWRTHGYTRFRMRQWSESAVFALIHQVHGPEAFQYRENTNRPIPGTERPYRTNNRGITFKELVDSHQDWLDKVYSPCQHVKMTLTEIEKTGKPAVIIDLDFHHEAQYLRHHGVKIIHPPNSYIKPEPGDIILHKHDAPFKETLENHLT